MSLDCEACDALLIDLVERELDETRAAAVRAHASGCETCGRALERLEGGRRAARELLRAEPPRLDAVMAAARARAAEIRAAAAAEQERRAEAVSAPPEPVVPQRSETWLEGAMRWLGAWATRPQVAMAALLVLMVGIGIFNLPQFRSHEGADPDGVLVEPDVRAELGPSALDPADPLELDVDPRTQRVALGSGEHEAPTEDDPTRDRRPTTTIASATAQDETSATHEERRPTPPTTHDATDTAEAIALEQRPAPAPEGLAVAEIAPHDGLGRVEDGPLPDLGQAGTSSEGSAVVLAPAPMVAPHPSAPTTPSAATGVRPVAPAYDEVEPPTSGLAAAMPAAIHRQARALAAAGHCDEALPRYRALLTDHPDYADAPRAMLELADCDRRLGRFGDAERWLTRAETFPSVSADARRLRTQVATARRAAERPVDQAGSSSSAAASERSATTTPDTASSY